MNILEWKHKLHGRPYRGGDGPSSDPSGGGGMTDATREALSSYQEANGITPGSVSFTGADVTAANAGAGAGTGGVVTGGDYYSDVNDVAQGPAPTGGGSSIDQNNIDRDDAGEYWDGNQRNDFGNFYDNTYAKAGAAGALLPGGTFAMALDKLGVFDRPLGVAPSLVENGLSTSGSGGTSYGTGGDSDYAKWISNLSNALGGANIGGTGDSTEDILTNALNHDPTATAQTAWNRWLDTDQPWLDKARTDFSQAAQDNWTAQKGFATNVMSGMDEWKANELPWLRNARDTLWADARSTADRINADADGSDANFRSYFDPVYGQMRDQVARYNNADFRQGYIDQSMADIQQQLQSAQGQDQRRRMAMGVNPNSGAFTSPGFGVNAAAAKANAANKMRLALDDKYTTGLSTLGEMGQYASNFGLENAKVKAAARKTAYDTTANAGEFGLNVGKQTQAYGDWLTNATNAASSAWGKGLTGLSTAGDFGLNVAKQGLNAANTVGSILDSRTNADANTVAAQTGRMNAQTNATKVANDSNSDDLAGLGSALGWAFDNRDALSKWWNDR